MEHHLQLFLLFLCICSVSFYFVAPQMTFTINTLVWYRKDILHRFRNTLRDEHDIHSRLMQYYPEVPMWWYGIIGIISFSFLCIAIKIISTQLPIWALVIAILLSFILSIPLSILMAISNQQITAQVIFELIAGYMLPGWPIANMIFKTVGYKTIYQATSFAGDLKLGHYMKVPPRIMFSIQIVPTIITSIWATFIQDWMLNNIEDICTPQQKQGFICPGSTVFATASVIFGAVGPQRLFSPGAPYATCLTHPTFTQLTLMPLDILLFFGSSPLGSLHPSHSTSSPATSLSPSGDMSISQLSSVYSVIWLSCQGSITAPASFVVLSSTMSSVASALDGGCNTIISLPLPSMLALPSPWS